MANSIANPLSIERMCIYFVASGAPVCAIKILGRPAEDNRHSVTEDIFCAVASSFYSTIMPPLKKGGLRLTKWVSNSRSFLSTIPEEDLVKGIRGLDVQEGCLPTK
jgi:hypothetical protein